MFVLDAYKLDTEKARLSDYVRFWPYWITDKHRDHNYISYYEEWFTPYRDRPVTVLEIGVKHGVSLLLWDDYFYRNAGVWGVDIKLLRRARWAVRNRGRIRLVEGPSDNPATAAGIDESFDIIIDDGAHDPAIQVATWHQFFPKLKAGGLYIIEDFDPDLLNGTDLSLFTDLWPEVELVDRRDYRAREDNFLIVYRKSTL